MLHISCKRAAELICESLDKPLGWIDSLRLRVHVWMCGDCRAFMAQNEALLQLFEERFHRLPDEELERQANSLPPAVCERLKQKLLEAAQADRHPED